MDRQAAVRPIVSASLPDRMTGGAPDTNRMWEVSSDLLANTDVDGICSSVNPAWTALLQWPDTELIGQSASWLVHPEDRDKSQINRRTVGPTPLLFENRLRHKNGTYRPFSWVAVRDGERIYTAARDISAMRRA